MAYLTQVLPWGCDLRMVMAQEREPYTVGSCARWGWVSWLIASRKPTVDSLVPIPYPPDTFILARQALCFILLLSFFFFLFSFFCLSQLQANLQGIREAPYIGCSGEAENYSNIVHVDVRSRRYTPLAT
jgi:hypothetical protein